MARPRFAPVEYRSSPRAVARRDFTDETTLAGHALAALPDPVVIIDALGRVRYANRAARWAVHLGSDDTNGRHASDVLDLRDGSTASSVDVQQLISSANESERPVERDGLLLAVATGPLTPVQVTAVPLLSADRTIIGTALILRNVTAVTNVLRRLAHQATHDGLTQLVNRDAFTRRLDGVLGKPGYAEHVVLFVDLDSFKRVNDTAGHAAGDAVLRQVASLFRRLVRDRDTVARLGGDEFGFLLEHCPRAQGLRTAEALRSALRDTRFRWQGKVFVLGVSIGAAVVRPGHDTVDRLLARADASCYAAKRRGGNVIELRETDECGAIGSPPAAPGEVVMSAGPGGEAHRQQGAP